MQIEKQQLASDNYSGACPEALAAITEANSGYAVSYGDDVWTEKACDQFREFFECDCEVFFVFNGTAANSLSLAHLCLPFHSVIAADTAHIETDECGAPEFFSGGSKILTAPNRNGKLTPDGIRQIIQKRDDIHYPKPHVLSLTQATEVGTIYTPDELNAIRALAAEHQLKIQMDGSRFANALAATGLTPAALSWQCGVDVLCCGGTKNGLPIGEAVIFFRKELAEDFAYRCKQGGQLCSKMRFLAAPWVRLLQNGAWLANARHANDMTQLLVRELAEIEGLAPLFPPEANSVFLSLPVSVQEFLRSRNWRFYNFIGQCGSRFMCSWDTTPETIAAFAGDVKEGFRRARQA